jgi:DNA-directed RNA polymerase alpha subunit|tara:strand:+ start:7625 stop:10342 length:2718 start_codon:yes stop_codon:yes gene_type:complete
MVHNDRTFESDQTAYMGKVIGVATDRKLCRLPNGGLGIYYQGEIKEVHRCSVGNLIATLSGESWEKGDYKEANPVSDYEFSAAEPYLALAVERYIDSISENSLSGNGSSSDNTSESNAETRYPISISESTPQLSKGELSTQKPSIYGPKTLYSLFFLPQKSNKKSLDRLVDEFELTVRSSNGLRANNVHTIGDLVLFSEFTLSKLPNLGKKSVLEIRDLVLSLGLSFKGSDSRAKLDIDSNANLFPLNEENRIVPNKLIKEFELTARSLNALSENKIHTVQDLMLLSEDELRKIPNLGDNSAREIIEFIVSLGIYKPDSENFFDPDDVLSLMHISNLDLSNRSLNCLEYEKIETIGNLVTYSKINLFKIPDLGKTCINDIEKKLANLGLSFDMTPRIRDIDNSDPTHGQPRNIGIEALYPFRTKMEDWILELLPSKKPELLERLIGQLTLEAMGDKMNVTRERVRQLQVIYEGKFHQHKELHIREINRLNLGASKSCHLFMLPMHSSYFDNIDKYIPNSNSFFAELFSDPLSKYRIEWIDGDSIVVLKDLPELEEVISTIKRLHITNDYDQYLMSVQRTDLRNYIHGRLKDQLPSSQSGKIRKYLRIIFDNSLCLMGLAELRFALLEQFDLEAEPNEVGNAINKLGDIYLFGPRGWGREDMFSTLDQSERLDIERLMIPILKASKGIDIHADELLNRIRDSNWHFSEALYGKLDKYQLNWLLKKVASTNPRIRDKGRLVWGYGSDTKRKTVLTVAIDMLHQHGRPLTTRELKKLILTQRSLGENFQLRPTKSQPDLIQLAANKWGLRNRDLPEITVDMETSLITAVLNHFKMEGPIIDSAKLTDIISGVGIDENCSFFVVSRLLLRYTSSGVPKKSKPLRVHISSLDEHRILVIDPQFKGEIPLI